MGRRSFVKLRNYQSPFGKASTFHSYYDDPPNTFYAEDEGGGEDNYTYIVEKCNSGVEVFEKHKSQTILATEEKYIYIFIEVDNKEKSNFFGTACRVKMGGKRKELMRNLSNSSTSISINDGNFTANNLKQWSEDIAKLQGIDAKALENAVRLELLEQNEFNQVLNTIFSLNNKLADWMNSGVEVMEKWKFTAENYDFDTYYAKPMYNNFQNNYGASGFPKQEVKYKPIIPIKFPNQQYAYMNGGKNIASTGINSLITLADKLDEIAFAIVYNTVKATPNIGDDIFFAVIYYIKNYLEDKLLGEFKIVFQKIKEIINQAVDFVKSIASYIEKFTYEKLAELNAFLCGLINGLISLLQTVIAILALIVGNIPFLELENIKPDIVAQHQEKLEFVEDLVDLIKENISKLFTGVISFFNDTKLWNELSKFVKELWLKVKGLNKYFWCFFIGGVLFEVILDVVIAYFTGGASAAAQITSKITRMATKAEDLAKQGVKIARNTSKKVAETASGLSKWIKQELEELIKAISEGKILAYLKKKFSQLFGIKYLDKIEDLEHLLNFIDTIDDQYTTKDLQDVGIEALFRGTTKDANGNPYTGNPNTIDYGISTSTDPVVATIFAIEGETRTGNKGYVQIVMPKNLKDVKLNNSNNRRLLELEVVLQMKSSDFTNSKEIIEISTDEARKLVKELYNIDLPKRIWDGNESTELLRSINRLDLKQVKNFFKKIK